MLLAGLFTWGVCEFALKPSFGLPRPFEVDPSITVIDARPVTRSFPSGHAATAVASALGGARMIPRSAWVWWPLAAVVAVSRIYIGVHWPSDVLGGAFIGLACAWFVLGGRAPRVWKRRAKDTGCRGSPRQLLAAGGTVRHGPADGCC
jgi:undecaprenyl-diphosphatase